MGYCILGEAMAAAGEQPVAISALAAVAPDQGDPDAAVASAPLCPR
jgi:hypothetical protein